METNSTNKTLGCLGSVTEMAGMTGVRVSVESLVACVHGVREGTGTDRYEQCFLAIHERAADLARPLHPSRADGDQL